mmetsp:Transcript_17865/g.29074  ORF Transcript_17865/g.29074 Transcript_17865/m.29074 type:complete len:204 (+) Transcript_17865:674-1285(+)
MWRPFCPIRWHMASYTRSQISALLSALLSELIRCISFSDQGDADGALTGCCCRCWTSGDDDLTGLFSSWGSLPFFDFSSSSFSSSSSSSSRREWLLQPTRVGSSLLSGSVLAVLFKDAARRFALDGEGDAVKERIGWELIDSDGLLGILWLFWGEDDEPRRGNISSSSPPIASSPLPPSSSMSSSSWYLFGEEKRLEGEMAST